MLVQVLLCGLAAPNCAEMFAATLMRSARYEVIDLGALYRGLPVSCGPRGSSRLRA